MSTTMVLITIGSVFFGFACFTAAFFLFMKGYSRAVVLALCLVALVTVTVIPVLIAVFFASTTNA